jgi:hypothetical protein
MNVMNKDINCTFCTRGIDNLLNNYTQKTNVILSLLNDEKQIPNIWSQLLSVDDNCECCLGQFDPDAILKSNTRCIECTNLDRITDFDIDIINKPFLVNVGSKKDQNLIINKYPNIPPKIIYSKSHKYSNDHITNYYNKLSVCDSKLDFKTGYIISDDCSNNYLISAILNQYTPNAIKIYTAFSCNNDLYILSENYNPLVLCLAEANNIAVSEVILQLLDFFNIAVTLEFTHNDVHLMDIQWSNIRNGKYSGTLKLNDFEHSCINYKNIKCIHQNTYSELFMKDEPVIYDITTKNINDSYSIYKFNYETGKKILHCRRLGVNLYSSSLDLYMYLIALCSCKDFYDDLQQDLSLFKVWNSLWNPDELEILNLRIAKNWSLGTHNIDVYVSLQTLSGLSLRCDVLSYLNKAMK